MLDNEFRSNNRDVGHCLVPTKVTNAVGSGKLHAQLNADRYEIAKLVDNCIVFCFFCNNNCVESLETVLLFCIVLMNNVFVLRN